MSITIDLDVAQQAIDGAVALADDPKARELPRVTEWIGRVTQFSEHCERVKYRSSIAVLGNAMLAKAADPSIDVFSLKASADDPGAFDARRTAENILVPAAQRHKFHLGVTGPQPLNNLTFLRHHRIEARMTVRANAKPLFTELIQLLHSVRDMRSVEATEALAAFIIVRRTYVPKYVAAPEALKFSTLAELSAAIDGFVRESSDRGARAMACSAALMDATFGEARVRLGKVHEPDRKVPGDVGLRRGGSDSADFERVLEIRDKPVHAHTIHPAVLKAVKAGIRKVTVVAVNHSQANIDTDACVKNSKEIGADLTIFIGWLPFISSLFAWASSFEQQWVETAALRVLDRLQELEQPAASSVDWNRLIAKT